jgi:hypothetical protein
MYTSVLITRIIIIVGDRNVDFGALETCMKKFPKLFTMF